MITEEIRKEITVLEGSIKEAVDKFILEVGACEIDVNIETVFNQVGSKKKLVKSNVEATVKI